MVIGIRFPSRMLSLGHWLAVLALTDTACARDPVSVRPDAAVPPDTAPAVTGTISVSYEAPQTRPTSGLGTNYWSWVPAWGDLIAGSEAQIQRLAPFVMRIGGYNNDANTPAPFDEAQLDLAVAYARAIGAEPILQAPLLADTTGARPSAATAAALVTYANLTKGYAIKYFSIGNEPDLYPDATGATIGIAGYTPASYCASVSAYVAAMKAADPSIRILGPELSWKYQSGDNDWLTPILQTCGNLFDVVTVHRYPIDPAQTTVASAAADAPNLRNTITHLRTIMQTAGVADKPLAITECNITWDGDPAKSTLPASPGTVPAGLWAADAFGVGLEAELWATAFWSTREGWTLGLLASADGKPQPTYWALDLFTEHLGKFLVSVTAAPSGTHAYAGRNRTSDGTTIIAINWNAGPAALTFEVVTGPVLAVSASFTLPALSMAAVEISDLGTTATALVYGETEHQAGLPPQPLLTQ